MLSVQGCASWFAAPAPRPVSVVQPVAPARAAAARAPHPVILAYKASLEGVLSEAEREALAAIDLGGTAVGDTQRLRYLAADRAVRVFLPAALDATGDPLLRSYARRIRALPPLLNRDTDAVAYEVVEAALRARARWQRGEMPTLEETAMAVRGPSPGGGQAAAAPADPQGSAGPGAGDGAPPAPAAPETPLRALHGDDPGARQQYADALAEYAEAYAQAYRVDALHADAAAAAAADAADAAVVLQQALAAGADRQALVEHGLGLLRSMAEAARRRERVPLPKPGPPPAQADPPAPRF